MAAIIKNMSALFIFVLKWHIDQLSLRHRRNLSSVCVPAVHVFSSSYRRRQCHRDCTGVRLKESYLCTRGRSLFMGGVGKKSTNFSFYYIYLDF